MKVQLVLAGPYSSCKETEQIWRNACLHQVLELEVLDLEHEDGKLLSEQLNLTSYPALIVNNSVIAVGNPDQVTANKLISYIASPDEEET